MSKQQLTPREEQIIEQCLGGLTRDRDDTHVGMSVGMADTYWLRFKLMTGAMGNIDTVVRVIKERAERALSNAGSGRLGLAAMIDDIEREVVEVQAALAMLRLAIDQTKSTVWLTDADLRIQTIANAEVPSELFGVHWEVGRTVYELFRAKDAADAAVIAHLAALCGERSEIRLQGAYSGLFLRVTPLSDESGEVMGCVGILDQVGD